ncbi:hypothetical protein FA15DRAFT_605978 [Coprinopsis marcescibilis]|uniref:Uncharacterized protein n=1 Tax=Coprinopsis marcescibilis TaxID=230819 RepID=A0A5C3KBH0_COPMA|nr:hypothetical protein FA15DRAFT_605978 [Coprinopsis marcescibilis]
MLLSALFAFTSLVPSAIAHPAAPLTTDVKPTTTTRVFCPHTICGPCPTGSFPTSTVPAGQCPICGCAPTTTTKAISPPVLTQPPCLLDPCIATTCLVGWTPTIPCLENPCIATTCLIGSNPIILPPQPGERCSTCSCSTPPPAPTLPKPIICSLDPCAIILCPPTALPVPTSRPGDRCSRCSCSPIGTSTKPASCTQTIRPCAAVLCPPSALPVVTSRPGDLCPSCSCSFASTKTLSPTPTLQPRGTYTEGEWAKVGGAGGGGEGQVMVGSPAYISACGARGREAFKCNSFCILDV